MAKTSAATKVANKEQEYDLLLDLMQGEFKDLVTTPGTKLYTTDATGLWDLYLSLVPDADRQYHTCNCCRRFIERFGGLVTISEKGSTKPAVWHPEGVGAYYQPAIAALQKRVAWAKVTGVFASEETTWGWPQTPDGPQVWTHFSVVPPKHLVFSSKVATAYQESAEKAEDFKNMLEALKEYNLETVTQACTLLQSDNLYRSEKVLGVAEWLRELIYTMALAKTNKAKINILWRAVATAPVGFAHPRSSMIGTLLDDLAEGLKYADVAAKFKAKMHPLQYQRPQADPKAGAIAQAEKIVEQMGVVTSLERRFARLEDLQTIWTPAPAAVTEQKGVFGHLNPPVDLKVPATTVSWAKFLKDVVPLAQRIEVYAPYSGNYCAYLTAADAYAPPILQWDHEDARNPVSWYVYHGGSQASKFNLSTGWQEVTALSLQPNMWHGDYSHQGAGVLFVIEDCRDLENKNICLFPEFLKSELHGVRSVIEAYSKSKEVQGLDEASACGLIFQKATLGKGEANRIRVTMNEYSLDRWE
jgi:hypothetical protein